jgi:hypothetical protein
MRTERRDHGEQREPCIQCLRVRAAALVSMDLVTVRRLSFPRGSGAPSCRPGVPGRPHRVHRSQHRVRAVSARLAGRARSGTGCSPTSPRTSCSSPAPAPEPTSLRTSAPPTSGSTTRLAPSWPVRCPLVGSLVAGDDVLSGPWRLFRPLRRRQRPTRPFRGLSGREVDGRSDDRLGAVPRPQGPAVEHRWRRAEPTWTVSEPRLRLVPHGLPPMAALNRCSDASGHFRLLDRSR